MNIFKILSSGDGSIKEPNVTAFLSYLLEPNEGHGLNSNFLELFLWEIVRNEPNLLNSLIYNERMTDLTGKSRFTINISIEKSVFIKSKDQKRRDIDIVIEIYGDNQNLPLYVFCIENKIQDGALNKNQLAEEAEGILDYYNEVVEGKSDKLPIISFIFLTKSLSEITVKEFEAFNENISNFVEIKSTIHLPWKITKNNPNNSVVEMLQSLLQLEAIGSIDPIHEYTKYTIKSFMNFINNDFKSYIEEKETIVQRKNYGKPVKEYFKDLFDTLNDDEELKVDEAKKRVMNAIKKQTGKDVSLNTLRCQFYLVVVNERNRIHYGVNEPLSQNKNLFYYTDTKNRLKIKKFINTNHIDNVKVYWKEDGNIQNSLYKDLNSSI